MGILGRWLGDVSLARFHDAFLRRAPWATPATGRDDVALFGWDTLDRVLAASPPPDVLVVARGELLPVPAPRSVVETRALMDAGIGLAMRQTQRCDGGLARLADELAGDVGGTAHVQLFVTPGRTHGFGWHYDDEDVFILQTAGVKDYYFRANTVASDLSARPSAFARFATETSPLCTARLLAGDFLYIPSRWWHMAICEEDALSISTGIAMPS